MEDGNELLYLTNILRWKETYLYMNRPLLRNASLPVLHDEVLLLPSNCPKMVKSRN
jgi:hypothetical protein